MEGKERYEAKAADKAMVTVATTIGWLMSVRLHCCFFRHLFVSWPTVMQRRRAII